MLKEAFQAYCREVEAATPASQVMPEDERPTLYLDPALKARSWATERETTRAYEDLVTATVGEFARIEVKGKRRHSQSATAYRSAIGHFFRRAGYYLNILEGKQVDPEGLFHLYTDAWTRETCTATYLALVEFVYFGRQSFDFGSYRITRHSTSELDQLLSNRSREAFYPWAAVDTALLSDYWLISSSVEEQVRGIGHIPVDLSNLHRVELRYTRLPAPIERALDTFCLFEWQADMFASVVGRGGKAGEKGFMGWEGPKIPFVLRLTDNLLEPPSPSPDTSVLCQEAFFDHEGEYLGDRPCVYTHFSGDEAAAFGEYILSAQALMDFARPREDCWPFLRVALGNLKKAFFTQGLEQLLWHITALEALLGEKGEGVTERLARRIALILAGTDRQRKEIRKEFKALYAFRSNLVHGNTFENETYRSHLYTARELARRSTFWFLNYLACVAGEGDDCASLPQREDLLRLIELSSASRVHLGNMLTKVPAAFPCVDDWNPD